MITYWSKDLFIFLETHYFFVLETYIILSFLPLISKVVCRSPVEKSADSKRVTIHNDWTYKIVRSHVQSKVNVIFWILKIVLDILNTPLQMPRLEHFNLYTWTQRTGALCFNWISLASIADTFSVFLFSSVCWGIFNRNINTCPVLVPAHNVAEIVCAKILNKRDK